MKGICGKCHFLKELRRIKKKGKTSSNICDSCFNQDPLNHEVCIKCGQKRPVQIRDSHGRAICHRCYCQDPARHKICSKCRRLKQVATRDKLGRPICHNCYRQQRKKVKCLDCRKKKIIQALGLCGGCYKRQWRAYAV
jgi:hypothetical protein